MKKQLLNLGKALNKAEQKQIFGGFGRVVTTEASEDGDGGGGCSLSDGLYCKCPPGSNGNAEGCGCNEHSDCVMGKCWKGMWGVGMFGMCDATL